jgi:2-dehydro-3-deoxyphosphogluconate aldolase / (4S)-4-hydroxy-2-oxoglutarate aldolase
MQVTPKPVSIPALLEASRVVAILRHTDPSLAVPSVEALVAGGITAIEVTFNSQGVLDMLRAIQLQFGDRVLLGAGTVLDREQAEAALELGARFIVSPHTDAELVAYLAQRGVLAMPGALSPTEVLAAHRAGAAVVKLFPAGAVGPSFMQDVRGPLGHIPLMPTGGITLENADAFITAGAWGLGVGSALANPTLIQNRRFADLEARARSFASIAQRARSR